MDAPEIVIQRLPQYLRALTELQQSGVEVVSSQLLGARLQVTPAQIRKDLSHFGRFGKQGRGYSIQSLVEELRHILGLDRTWNVAIVGVGRLGRAIISYPGFGPESFRVVCAFDADNRLVGQLAGGLMIQPISQLAQVIEHEQVHLVIVAVPAADAQAVIDELVACGVKAVLNYAPIAPQTPPDVQIRSIDPVLALQSMTYYLSSSEHGVVPKCPDQPE